MSINQKRIKKILSGLMITTTALSLQACNSNDPGKDSVLCKGVGKSGPDSSVLMTKGMCAKLAGGTPEPTTQIYKDPGADAYVECYGVVAAGENDCATNTSSCGGTNAVDKSPAAWIAIPKGICEQINGGVLGKLSKSKVGPDSSTTTNSSDATNDAKS
jgi:uncharacterized membrane protein